MQNWSLFVERELSRDYALSVGYIGKKGSNLLASRPFNSAIFTPGTDANGKPLSTRGNQDDRVPFLPGVYGSDGLYLDNPFRSNYHSVQIELKKRFSRGLQFNTSYTLAKSLDNSSTTNLGGCLTDPFRVDHDYGRSSWDRRHAYKRNPGSQTLRGEAPDADGAQGRRLDGEENRGKGDLLNH